MRQDTKTETKSVFISRCPFCGVVTFKAVKVVGDDGYGKTISQYQRKCNCKPNTQLLVDRLRFIKEVSDLQKLTLDKVCSLNKS